MSDSQDDEVVTTTEQMLPPVNMILLSQVLASYAVRQAVEQAAKYAELPFRLADLRTGTPISEGDGNVLANLIEASTNSVSKLVDIIAALADAAGITGLGYDEWVANVAAD